MRIKNSLPPLVHVVITIITVSIASISSLLRAEESAVDPSRTSPSRPCVLLSNDNVLFGQARQVGELVIVQTSRGGEVKLPRKSVACWSSSMEDLYRYRVDHRQNGVIASHLRDANWCLRNDLWELAQRELTWIKKIDPRHRSIASIENRIRRASHPPTATSVVIKQPLPVRQAGAQDDAASMNVEQAISSLPSAADLVSLRRFASHVQPMLVNRCGRCHSKVDDSVSFRLNLPPAGSRASSKMTRENLATTMAFVNVSEPDQSELLVKATSAHGGIEAPLNLRSAKAIESLRRWLFIASTPRMAAGRVERVEHKTTTETTEAPITTKRPVIPATIEPVSKSSVSGQPARLPSIANPFDPDLFNRRFHPKSPFAPRK